MSLINERKSPERAVVESVRAQRNRKQRSFELRRNESDEHTTVGKWIDAKGACKEEAADAVAALRALRDALQAQIQDGPQDFDSINAVLDELRDRLKMHGEDALNVFMAALLLPEMA